MLRQLFRSTSNNKIKIIAITILTITILTITIIITIKTKNQPQTNLEGAKKELLKNYKILLTQMMTMLNASLLLMT